MPLYKLVRPYFSDRGALIDKGECLHFEEGKQPKGSKLMDAPKPEPKAEEPKAKAK